MRQPHDSPRSHLVYISPRDEIEMKNKKITNMRDRLKKIEDKISSKYQQKK